MFAERHEQAGLMLAQALQECANYGPAADALGACYQRLGMAEELAALNREWSEEPDQPEQLESVAAGRPAD
jgi:hypothetical protein